jgi:trimeric autotransporter adhesin
MAVGITADGQLGVRASSERFKEAIKPMDKTSEAIFSLQPVTFRYKKAFDSQALPQFGLVAEQVAKVNPDLVARDAEGKPFIVRYDEVNAMLLNEFLKEHGKVEQLKTTVSEQEKQIATLTAGLKEQGAQIQKVSAQLGVNKQSLQTVAANHQRIGAPAKLTESAAPEHLINR